MSNPELESTPAPEEVEFVKLNRIEPPHWHWFYQRLALDGELDQYGQPKEYPVFSCGEQEAAALDKRLYRQLGASDGKAYFEHLRKNIKPDTSYPKKEAQRILHEAFNLELEVAKKNGRRTPVEQKRFFGGASPGTANIEEFVESWIGRR